MCPREDVDALQLVGWVRYGVPCAVTAEQARHVVDIIESGYRSAETGTVSELRPTFALPPLDGVGTLAPSESTASGRGSRMLDRTTMSDPAVM